MRPFGWWEHAAALTFWSGDGAAHIYIRYRFELPAGAIVTGARLTTIVDDEHSVYLNGDRVGFDPLPAEIPIVESDLSGSLVPGENLLAIDALDQGGCRWAVASGTIRCAQ